MQPGALTVSALVGFLREVLEASEHFSDLWIAGEVSNFSRPSSGHRYFSLKDPGATLRAVMFRDTMPSMTLQDGDRVLAHGRVTVYPQRGELQFVVDFIRPAGVGIVSARFEQLKAKLEEEGLFDPLRKRPLPRFPVRIGVVTSPTGAALQDIRNVLARRWPLAEVVLAPATVQGEQAAPHVVGALAQLAREPIDVAILARGGGSAEDLWAFNDERVARAVFGFPVPIVTGVGHETDETIVDYIADLRAATPTAAAERATPSVDEVYRNLLVFDRAMASACREAIGVQAGEVAAALARVHRAGPDLGDLARRAERVLAGLEQGALARLAERRRSFEGATATLRALDPGATLARGFAIVQDAQTRKVISRTKQVKPGARLQVAVTDGAFWTEVS